MKKINTLVGIKYRAPTGPLRIGSDWPGIFLRGDEAQRWSCSLEKATRELAKLSKEACPPHDLELSRLSVHLHELKVLLESARLCGDQHDRVALERDCTENKRVAR